MWEYFLNELPNTLMYQLKERIQIAFYGMQVANVLKCLLPETIFILKKLSVSSDMNMQIHLKYDFNLQQHFHK